MPLESAVTNKPVPSFQKIVVLRQTTASTALIEALRRAERALDEFSAATRLAERELGAGRLPCLATFETAWQRIQARTSLQLRRLRSDLAKVRCEVLARGRVAHLPGRVVIDHAALAGELLAIARVERKIEDASRCAAAPLTQRLRELKTACASLRDALLSD